MIKKVLETIKENNMFNVGDKVIVGVSGGPDSMCLLHLLYRLKDELKISIAAVHINHCLRGQEADKDEKYVENYCSKLGIEFFSKKVDVNKLADDKNLSCEMAGRDARYLFYKEIFNKINAQKVALAHNANDQCETVLMRIMRGTGIEGIVGIKPVRDNVYVRPIINITRSEIEKYCDENNLEPRIDKTNLENIYTRNKVRLELIPYIQKNFNNDIINVVNRLSSTVAVDNDFLEQASKEVFSKSCYIDKERVIISKEVFLKHEAIVTRVIRTSINYLLGNLLNISKVHIHDIIEIQRNETGKSTALPNSVIAINNYGNIELMKKNNFQVKDNNEYELKIGENIICNQNLLIKLEKLNTSKNIKFSKNNLIKYFDLDKINGNIILRFRREGDKFTPLGMKGSKKLKSLFIDLKVPKDEREKTPLICFGEEIGWIVNYRVSDNFKVDNTTKNILRIKIERKEL